MDPHQNPERHLSVYNDTPIEGLRVSAQLEQYAEQYPGYQIAPLTNEEKVVLVRDSFHMTEVDYTGCEGTYGSIVTGKDPETNQKVAVKLIPCRYKHNLYRELVHEPRVNRELYILNELRGHDHILKIFAAIWGPMRNALIQTEFLGQTLGAILELHSLKESNIVRLGKQLTEALQYLQAHKIVHHDIKPDNIMMVVFVDPKLDSIQVNQQLMDSTFKFIDFGCAKIYLVDNPIEKYFRKGSPMYKSPEKLYSVTYNANSCDLFGLGVCLFQAYFGLPNIVEYLKATPEVVDKSTGPNWLKVAQAILPVKQGPSLEYLIFGLLEKESERLNVNQTAYILKLLSE